MCLWEAGEESLRKVEIELIWRMGMLWNSGKKQKHAGCVGCGEGGRLGLGVRALAI